MIFRRIKAHIENENWFAVLIDFCIVVVGVFIGIQVANWNDVRKERLSEAQYLQRFADDIEQTIEQIQEERAFSDISSQALEQFAAKLFDQSTSGEELISATTEYLSTGSFFAKFSPHRATFDDLITTGNFDIIRDEEIRKGLMRLHARYDDAQNIIQSNIEWQQQGEELVYFNFDAFRFDRRTRKLFDSAPVDKLAADIRSNRDLLRRHAAFHYWLKVRSIELYDEVEPQARSVLQLIRHEQTGNGRADP